jgi:hypothetical protein
MYTGSIIIHMLIRTRLEPFAKQSPSLVHYIYIYIYIYIYHGNYYIKKINYLTRNQVRYELYQNLEPNKFKQVWIRD